MSISWRIVVTVSAALAVIALPGVVLAEDNIEDFNGGANGWGGNNLTVITSGGPDGSAYIQSNTVSPLSGRQTQLQATDSASSGLFTGDIASRYGDANGKMIIEFDYRVTTGDDGLVLQGLTNNDAVQGQVYFATKLHQGPGPSTPPVPTEWTHFETVLDTTEGAPAGWSLFGGTNRPFPDVWADVRWLAVNSQFDQNENTLDLDNFRMRPFPEPASAILLGLGGMVLLRRRSGA